MNTFEVTGNPIKIDWVPKNSVKALVLQGKTTQSGTGDPSPTNIRPIYGVGQYDKKIVIDGINVKITNLNGQTETQNRFGLYVSDKAPGALNLMSSYLETAKNVPEYVFGRDTSTFVEISFLKERCEYSREAVNSYFAAHPLTIYYQSTTYSTATQVYIGFSVTDANGYHGYAAGPTAPLFDGDTLDFVTGECKRTKGYIASYAGEVLPGKWISDRDVYAAGATPTTGAQVVYELATPTTETVPISEPITNAAGPIEIVAENTMTGTFLKSEVVFPPTVVGYNDLVLNGKRISEYGGKMLRDFTVSGSPLDNQYFKGRNRTNFTQLASVIGFKTLTLPIVFDGTDKHDAMLKRSTFEGDAYGTVELWLPDGFYYKAMLQTCGDPENIGDSSCKVEYTFLGLQHGTLSKTVGNTVICESTMQRTDCILTVTASVTSTTYSLWGATFDVVKGQTITFDGYNKRILINGAPAAQKATWTEFPYLTRGLNVIQCVDTVTVEYYPTYI